MLIVRTYFFKISMLNFNADFIVANIIFFTLINTYHISTFLYKHYIFEAHCGGCILRYLVAAFVMAIFEAACACAAAKIMQSNFCCWLMVLLHYSIPLTMAGLSKCCPKIIRPWFILNSKLKYNSTHISLLKMLNTRNLSNLLCY